MEVKVKTINLTKVYWDKYRGEVRACDKLNFECYSGEIFGLLGPNGAGKTTTLRTLATIIKPTEGTAFVNGYDILKEPQKVRNSIGFLSSTTALYPKLTPREILTYFGKLYGLSKKQIEERMEEIFEKFQMWDFIDVKCEQLSTGMKQKTSIARAIIHNPPVLILDEPTVGLDVIVASAMIDFILSYKSDDKLIIFSTHIMREAEKICDRIAIINKGKILAVGTLDELRKLTDKFYLEDIFISLVKEYEKTSI